MDDMFSAIADSDPGMSEGPIPGQLPSKGKKVLGPDYKDVEVKYIVANMSDSSDRILVESIMTRSLRSMSQLKEPGDVLVVREDQSFSKEGEYFVAIKYCEKMPEEK